LLHKLRDTGTVDRRPGSGRRRSARTDENVELVDELALSQSGPSNILDICYNQPVLFSATRTHNTTGAFQIHPQFPEENALCLE